MPTSVVLLTQPNCGFCEHAKDVLQHLSSEFDLEVLSMDTDTPDGQALAESANVVFPPGVFVDGELFSHGRLSERKLRRHLRRRADTAPEATTKGARCPTDPAAPAE